MTAEILIDPSPVFDAANRLTDSVGIETLGGVFTVLLSAGSVVPCSVTEIFSTASDNQSSIEIHLFRGRGALVVQNHDLGRFEIVDIAPAPRGIPKIEVGIVASHNGLSLRAHDPRGGRLRIVRAASTDS